MKRARLLLISTAILFIAISGCISSQKETAASQFVAPHRDVSVQWVKEIMGSNKDILILDVRTEAEFAQGHLEGAVNIPHFEIEERYKELNAGKDMKLIVYCQWGGRSKIAAEKLSKSGFMNIYNMVGGLEQWWKVYGESNYIK